MRFWPRFFYLFFLLVSLSGSLQASTLTLGVVGGVRLNSASTDLGGASMSSQTGWMFGALGWLPLNRGFGLRSGGVYNQRYVNLGPTNQGDIDIRFAYFDIPLTMTYDMTNLATIFAGPVFGFSQSKEVSCSKAQNCSAAAVKSLVVPVQVGLDMNFLPNFGGEIFVEMIQGELAGSVLDMQSVGISAIYFFN